MSWEDILKQKENIREFLKDAKAAYESYEEKDGMDIRLDLMVSGKQNNINDDVIIMVIMSMRTDKPILDVATLNQAIRAKNAKKARKPRPPRRKGQRKNRRR